MTTKDKKFDSDPWKIWPDGIVPAEGNRPAWRLRTPEEGKAWLKEIAKRRKAYRVPDSFSAIDEVRLERDEE